MPGDYEQKFDNLRAYIAYMYAHPGKKLLFMGCELAQFDEWSEEKTIGWDLLRFDKHRQFKDFSRELFQFYRDTPAMWEQDGGWDGFDWLSCDNAEQNIISFLRRDQKGNEVIVICNFSSVTREDYRIGVPRRGRYDEIFSTDAVRFGGKGTENTRIYTKQTPMHGRSCCVSLTLPAFSTIYLYKKASAPKASATVEKKGTARTASKRVKAESGSKKTEKAEKTVKASTRGRAAAKKTTAADADGTVKKRRTKKDKEA